MIDKLEQVELRFEKVNELICEPEVVNDQNQYKELMRELKNLTPVVECFRAYKEADKTEKEALELLSDASQDKDFKELLEEEYKESKQKKEELFSELKTLLLPKDPNDYRNVIIEIRGGAGGDEPADHHSAAGLPCRDESACARASGHAPHARSRRRTDHQLHVKEGQIWHRNSMHRILKS